MSFFFFFHCPSSFDHASFSTRISVLLTILAFRFGVYVPLCCFHQEGGKSQAAAAAECDYPADQPQNELAEAPFFRPRDFLFLLRENLREQFSSPPHMPIHTCPPPTHSHTPELIRTEVEELKSDFNRRIKEVLFNSLFSAYYVAFLPLCFVKVRRLRWAFLSGAQRGYYRQRKLTKRRKMGKNIFVN